MPGSNAPTHGAPEPGPDSRSAVPAVRSTARTQRDDKVADTRRPVTGARIDAEETGSTQ